ncbi:MAG: PilN domain-containing protein [Bacillus sp. (in: Bacteria)]|nr:PilN domain-containing protein [Bacillus sp. (in: firmicutes)]
MAFYLNFEKTQLIRQAESKERNLEIARELRMQVEEQLNSGVVTSASVQLEQMIEWMETVPVSSIHVMNHLTQLLPSQGFINSVSYGDSGSVSLNTEFNNLEQVTAYLYHLQQSDWVKEVVLQNVSASEEDNEVAYYSASFSIQLDIASIKAYERGEK